MKHFAILSSLAISLFFVSCKGKAQGNQSTATNIANKIEVIDFYGTHRCVTCKAIEASTKYTLDTYFSDEQKNGTIVFKTVNVDDKKNYEIAENFEASGTSLFLNVIIDGKESHINLTDFGYAKGRDQEAFSKELKAKIDTALKTL